MYNVSNEFKEYIKKPGRYFKSKVIIRDKEYDDNVIIDMSQEEMVNPEDDFSLGSVVSTKFEITLLEVEEIFENAEVKPYIGLSINGTVEYVPLGVFTVDEVNRQNKKVKLTCFDNMMKMEKPYFSDLNYPATLQAIAEEISAKAGVIFNSTLPNHTIDKIEGYSLREAIGFVASACGGFARFNRIGQLEIKSYTDTDIVITGDNYFNFETADKEYKINKITAIKGEEQLSKGNVDEFGREVVFENPVITDSILTDIYNKLNPFSYMPYTLKWQGNLALEAGDKIKIIDIKGNEYSTIVMQQRINYNGGLSAETKAVGKSEQRNKFDSKGSVTKKIERYSIEQANIRKALIEKASIMDLEAVNAKIENALIEKLDVIDFNAKVATIEKAIIEKAEIEDLKVLEGEINTLRVVDLKAVKGDITNLTSSVADINTLLNGNLTSDNMQAGAITATSGVIANGAITNAMIANVSADKINAGYINTNNVTVKSEEGNLRIEGSTLKVWDDEGKERISLGKNDTDYDLLVRGKDGQTVLFGADGVTNAGITEGAIDDSKVADNANIDGSKLNIGSVVQSINNSTTKIESSNINYDGKSLNVAFGELETNFNNLEIGGRNLILYDNITKNQDQMDKSKYKTEGTIKLITEQKYSGARFICENLYPNTKYTVSYKYKKISGTLISFGGHTDKTYSNNTTYIDGVKTSAYSNCGSVFVRDDNNIHSVIVQIQTPDTVDPSHYFYIQPNRGYTTAEPTTVEIYDLKLEKGTKPTDWTPAPEDVQTDIETRVKIADFTIEQGKIATLISDVSTVQGEVNSTSSNVSSLTQTVNSLKSSISSIETESQTIKDDITGLSTEINTTQSNLAQFKQDLDGFKTTVHDTYATRKSVTDVDNKVTRINEKTNTLESEITQNKADIAMKVSQTEVDKSIDKVEIGGRNLLSGTSNEYRTISNTWWGKSLGTFYPSGGDKITVRAYVKPDMHPVGLQFVISTPEKQVESGIGTIINPEEEGYVTKTYTMPENATSAWIQLRHPTKYDGNNIVQYKELKVEKGTKPTDWTPSPEDIDTKINSKIAEVNIDLDSITSRVGSYEKEISSLGNRVSSTESTITQLKDNINLKVSQTVNQTVNEIIGGRNLLLDSGEEQSDLFIVYDVSDSITSLNSMYTFSAILSDKYVYDNITVQVVFLDHAEGVNFNIFTEIVNNRIEFTFDGNILIKEGLKTIDIINITNMRTELIFTKAKLEEGAQATTWTPAPEDMDFKITKVDDKVAEIDIELDKITSRVERVEEDNTVTKSSITQLADKIEHKVSKADYNSSITQLSNRISSKVSESDFTGNNIVSMIEQTPSYIKLSADKINLQGITNVSKELTLGSGYESSSSIVFTGQSSIYVEGDNMYIGAQSSINFLSSTIFYNYVDFSSATSNIKGLPLQPYWPANPFYLDLDAANRKIGVRDRNGNYLGAIKF